MAEMGERHEARFRLTANTRQEAYCLELGLCAALEPAHLHWRLNFHVQSNCVSARTRGVPAPLASVRWAFSCTVVAGEFPCSGADASRDSGLSDRSVDYGRRRQQGIRLRGLK